VESHNTKPLIFFVIIAMVIGVTVLAILAIQSLHSPQQDALSQYVRGLHSIQPGLVVSEVVQAGQPNKFTASMSGDVYGSGTYFHVDMPFSFDTTVSQTGSSSRPLPYPPEQLACVLLGSNTGPIVVFLALHGDDYKADWFVHQSRFAWSSNELQAQLSTLGCEFTNP
jgi:hypothetical protein